MRNLFFYGTLRHIPLLEIVLGRGCDAGHFSAATLPGYRVSAVEGEPFPMIAVDPASHAIGLVAQHLSDQDSARINFFEGCFAYDLVPVTLSNGIAAEVYVPQPGLWTAAGAWHLEDWIAASGAMSCEAAREVMSYIDQRDQVEVARMFPMIRARAASRLRGPEAQHGDLTSPGRVEIEAVDRPYSKFFALDDVTLRHQRFDGRMSRVIERGVFVAADAALVLPYDPVTDQVLLVEQIRIGPLMRADKVAWQLEPIAGRIDPGETPEQAARREALEEAGLTLNTLETIAEVYPSPGTSTEFYYVFIGLADLSHVKPGLGGVESEDEDIKIHILPFGDLMALVQERAVANAPLALTAYWLSHHRERLRSVGPTGTS